MSDPAADKIHLLEKQLAAAREELLDREDELRRCEAQHEVLESFCFALEQEHGRARVALEATRAELQASYDSLRTLKQRQDDILENVSQGILTINADGTINAGYSRITEQMFERGRLDGLRFASLFDWSPELEARVQRHIELTFGNPHASRQVLTRLNPIASCEYTVRGAGAANAGEAKIKLLSCSFARIAYRDAEGGAPPRATKLMVVVDDRTAVHRLNQELERRAREQAEKVERAYQLLTLPPDAVRDFVREATGALEEIEGLICQRDADRASREQAVRLTHILKGDARALGLDGVSQASHRLEEALLAGSFDGHATESAYLALKAEIADSGGLFMRFTEAQATLRASGEEHAEALGKALRNLAEAEARANRKEVALVFERGPIAALTPAVAFRVRTALVQLVRNAVVHGLEAPEERERRGKQRAGRIVIRIDHQRDARALIVTCRDDGGGIEASRLRQAAVAAGAITPSEAEAMGDEEALGLVFLSRVSTAGEVTESAGRGVGMNVVKHSVEALGGRAQVRSVRGEHTEIELRLPLNVGRAPEVPATTPPVEAA